MEKWVMGTNSPISQLIRFHDNLKCKTNLFGGNACKYRFKHHRIESEIERGGFGGICLISIEA